MFPVTIAAVGRPYFKPGLFPSN